MTESYKYLEIDGSKGNPIRLNIEFSQIENDAPVVIIAHGFKAHKDWSFIPVLAHEFAYHGFHVVRFSNSHSGVVYKSSEFTEKEKFADNSLSKELFDFTQVLNSTLKGEIYDVFVKSGKKINGLHIVGHSRGSANALIVASENIQQVKFDSIICFSPISHFKHYTDQQFQDWLTQGYIEISEPNTDTTLRMNNVYYDDMLQNAERYDLQITVENLADAACPVLFIRGNEDRFILQEEAEDLVSWSQGKFELEIVIGSKEEPADHNFGMPAKATELNLSMNWAFKIALRFIKLHSR